MKKYILNVFFMLIFGSCSAITKEQYVAHKIIDDYSIKAKKNYSFTVNCTGLSFPDKIREFIVGYKTQKKLNIAEARVLLINASQDFLNIINTNLEIKHILNNYPFTGSNLEFTITFYNIDGKRVSPPNLAMVSIINGIIYYSNHNNETGKFNDVHKESYAEALKMVQGKS